MTIQALGTENKNSLAWYYQARIQRPKEVSKTDQAPAPPPAAARTPRPTPAIPCAAPPTPIPRSGAHRRKIS